MPITETADENALQTNQNPTANEVIWGTAALTFLASSMAGWIMRGIPECTEVANICGGVAFVALIANWVCVKVQLTMDSKNQ